MMCTAFRGRLDMPASPLCGRGPFLSGHGTVAAGAVREVLPLGRLAGRLVELAAG